MFTKLDILGYKSNLSDPENAVIYLDRKKHLVLLIDITRAGNRKWFYHKLRKEGFKEHEVIAIAKEINKALQN